MLLGAPSLPHLSLLSWIIFCVREQITSKWTEFHFLWTFSSLFFCGCQGRTPARKGKNTTPEACKSDFENQKGANLDALQPRPAQPSSGVSPSRWDGDPQWNQLKDNVHPGLHCRRIYAKFQVTVEAIFDSQYQIQQEKYKEIPCSSNWR